VIYLGKILLRWCLHCNVPVLGETCGICTGGTEKVMLTPPGDIRPAFAFDRELLQEVVERQFGRATVPEVMLLNNVPAIDRMDEVIFDGRVAGALRYHPEEKRFRFLPRLWYASLLQPTRGYVVADQGAVPYILKSENLMAPGVVEASPEIRTGDEVAVYSPRRQVIAVGRGCMDAAEMQEAGRGMAVKVRRKGEDAPPSLPPSTWDQVLAANQQVIDEKAAGGVAFIRRAVNSHDLPMAVSFSGGKDSLATLLLVLDAGYRPPLLFVDTGLEFPETVEHVHAVAKELELTLLEERAGDAFWEAMELFGPPARDYRWCCKTCKLGPTSRLIKKHFPLGVLSFIGQRRYESEQRSRKGSVWKNPWVAEQVGASPIQHWTALHVWLYLFRKRRETGISWNPLYEQGFSRIGCWPCPASDLAEFAFRRHPQWDRLARHLSLFARQHGLPQAWIERGLWRWRRPPDWSHLPYSISTERHYPLPDDVQRIAGFLRVLGPVEQRDERTFTVNGELVRLEPEAVEGWPEEVKEVVYRALHCTGCGVCLGKCPRDAIAIREGKAWMGQDCIHCGQCNQECVVLVFG